MRFPLALVLLLTPFIFLSSCKKVNEATLLGGGLVPEVDNINTFETTFATETRNLLLNDTTILTYPDPVAVGTISNDPEFGQTTASAYFQISSLVYGRYPFSGPNPTIDSVVLSLGYSGGYGDTNTQQTLHVYEINPNSTFNDTTFYSYHTQDFETTGPELGSASFAMSSMKDSVGLIRKQDTTVVANQLRIRLDNAFGARLASYDSTTGSNGGFHNDTLFKQLFHGFALKSDGGNGLAYFTLANTNTALTVYYRATKSDGTIDTSQVVFEHALPLTTSAGGQANVITRQPGGGWASYLKDSAALADKLYIQSTPEGSAGYIKIPSLDTFQNKLIHRAELIATRLPSSLDNVFWAPDQLFVDRINAKGDSAFVFPEYVTTGTATNGATIYTFSNYTSFGGNLRTDQTYRFDITKLVQDVIAGRLTNPTLRIYAPYYIRPYYPITDPVPATVQVVPFPAYGRVVLAGGNYADAGQQLRLRVVYSKL